MIVTSTKAEVGLAASATSDQANIEGDFVLGLARKSLDIDAEKAYSLQVTIPQNGGFDLAPATGIVSNILGTSIIVSGSLTTDQGNIFIFPALPYVGEFNGKPSYRFENEYNELFCIKYTINPNPLANAWVLLYDETSNRGWYSFESVSTPQQVSSWNPATTETGTPVLSGGTAAGYEIKGGTGTDIDGNPLGTITPKAMLIESTKTISVDFNQGEVAQTMTINGGGFLLQCNASTPSSIKIHAPTGGEVDITLIGN